ncbi:Hypothetical predicted protein [Mytilus galloprovincialis]|uniref:Uncharacterized protein n=1 Tax=Mytilus galloprovincialis TaxID=29158 RepID=A0A8B6CH81_MYTGA|nr:Hypothetical predicted protein [Mytilus galloprovincialis]
MQSCLNYELIILVYSTETTCTSDSDPMTKSSVLKDYSDIFKGVGLVSGRATIHIDSEVPPVVHPPRRIPVALRGRLKSELDRMILRLQRYELDVVHLPGKCIPVADTLSRKFLSDTYFGLSDSFEAQVHMIFSSLPISDRKIEEIEKATLSDPKFDILKSVILEGWQQSRSECPAQILEF